MRTLTLACLAALTATAAADPAPLVSAVERGMPAPPSRIGLGQVENGSIAKLGVAMRSVPGHVHITLTLTFATTSQRARVIAMPIDLAPAISASALALSSSGGTEKAMPAAAEDARNVFEQ